jgi:hypothetical protein
MHLLEEIDSRHQTPCAVQGNIKIKIEKEWNGMERTLGGIAQVRRSSRS